MLVYSDAVDTNNDFHLYRGHFVAFNLRWDIVAGKCTRRRMDDTLHRGSSDTSVDADRDVEELGTAVHTGIDAKKIKLQDAIEQVLHEKFYENLRIKFIIKFMIRCLRW